MALVKKKREANLAIDQLRRYVKKLLKSRACSWKKPTRENWTGKKDQYYSKLIPDPQSLETKQIQGV